MCSNFRGISLLSVEVKVYGRVLIERSVIGEEQCGFRRGRGCGSSLCGTTDRGKVARKRKGCILGIYGSGESV